MAEQHEPFYFPLLSWPSPSPSPTSLPTQHHPPDIHTKPNLLPSPANPPHHQGTNSPTTNNSLTPRHGLQNSRPFDARFPPDANTIPSPPLQNTSILRPPSRRDCHRHACAEARRRFQRRVCCSPFPLPACSRFQLTSHSSLYPRDTPFKTAIG